MSKLTELRGQLDDRRQKLATVFQEAGENYEMDQVKSLEGDSAAKAAAIKALNDEMSDLGKQIDDLTEMDGIKSRVDELGQVQPPPVFGERGKQTVKSSGERFIESDAFKNRVVGAPTPEVDMGAFGLAQLGLKGLKTTVTRAVGIDPWEEQSPDYVPAFSRPLTVLDIISSSPTQSDTIIYRAQNAFVNSATTVAEGGTKPEGGFSTSRVTDYVEKIAVWIAVTDEELADVPGVRSLIDDDLTRQVRETLETQVISGNGTSPNISGILDRSGLQTQAKSTDPTPDAVYKAMTKVTISTGKRVNAAVFHPNDWQQVKLLRTSDGIYIWGAPMDNGPDRIWGVPVVVSQGVTENTALVGDFTQAKLRMREQLNIRVGYVNAQFISNEQTILAELRAALQVRMEAAFCTVTGI